MYKVGLRMDGKWLYIIYSSWDSLMEDLQGRFAGFEKISIGRVN